MEEKKNLATTYNPKEFEERIYKTWEEKKYFTPVVDKTKKPFSIVMPPPNITGRLHLGHALDNTLQDMLIRFKRMQGYCTLWLPGQDHASIATEVKVENELLKQGLVKKEMGREAFLEKVWEWSDEYRGHIREQLKKMGVSADFSREAFTMDENLNKAVRTVFVKLYNEGLIYQGNRITNWCPKCTTALSDAEIEYEEKEGSFWHINYPLADGSGYLEIATTRPETLLGDTAVAVNPNDERFKHIIGKTLKLPLTDREIPVVGDDYVDMELSIGDYVLTGGELGSMVVSDAVIRLLDGAIKEDSHMDDSFSHGLLEYPQYTRPQCYDGNEVPEVLMSGHHENIRKWRIEQSLRKTLERRPDLLEDHALTKEEEAIFRKILKERDAQE